MAESARIHSINVSRTRELIFAGQTITTGIFKETVAGPINVLPHFWKERITRAA